MGLKKIGLKANGLGTRYFRDRKFRILDFEQDLRNQITFSNTTINLTCSAKFKLGLAYFGSLLEVSIIHIFATYPTCTSFIPPSFPNSLPSPTLLLTLLFSPLFFLFYLEFLMI
jgi:hypothetical protein